MTLVREGLMPPVVIRRSRLSKYLVDRERPNNTIVRPARN
jgi:hypothetical protein